MKREHYHCVVIGGGSFGTVLASTMAGLGHKVHMWVRRRKQAEEISSAHRNNRYLPEFVLPETLQAGTDLQAIVPGAPLILMAVPSKAFRTVARELGESVEGDQCIVHATKGLEVESHKRMTQILSEETCVRKLGVISGPNLAREISSGQPAGALVASRYHEVIDRVQGLFSGGIIRMYSGVDVVGTEIAGSFKNIIALAAGIADGLGLGDNAKSLLLTRGLSEMARFGVALGADVMTFGGLAGIGDLMATCASPLSRNNQVGRRLGAGESLSQILESMTQVSEGVPTTKAVHVQSKELGLSLPIVNAIHGLLYDQLPVHTAAELLLSLPTGTELAQLRYS